MSPIELRVIGHFTDRQAARAALERLHHDARSDELEVVVRVPDKPHQTIPIPLSHARSALAKGVVVGGLTGLVMGFVVGWLGYRFQGLGPGIVLAFAAVGLALGLLGAALIGPTNPHPLIDKLEHEGGVTIVVDARDPHVRAWAEQVLREHGADIQHPHQLTPFGPPLPS